jgi:hypothetical protein
MSIEFLNKENVQLIWEIILDENIIQTNNSFEILQIRNFFIEQIQIFFEREKNNNLDLISLNKKFISLMIKTFMIKNSKQNNKPILTISNSTVERKMPITFEEIQNDKKSKFEKDYNSKLNDFQNAMTVPIPDKPNFQDNHNDQPISAMEELINQTLNERNLQMEMINEKSIQYENQAKKWINSQETSIRVEKMNNLQTISTFEKNGANPLFSKVEQKIAPIDQALLKIEQPQIKYIKIGEEVEESIENNVIDLLAKKQISWGNNEHKTLNDIDFQTFERKIESKYLSSIETLSQKIFSLDEKINIILSYLQNQQNSQNSQNKNSYNDELREINIL